MITSVTSSSIAPKTAVASAPPTASKTTAPAAPDTARGSVGETAAGNVRAETAKAVDAPEQVSVAPRLRDQETSENSKRRLYESDRPAGPPPAFEETPLERQARVALDPPDAATEAEAPSPEPQLETDGPADRPAETGMERESTDPPPTPSEKAEASFAETRTMSATREKATLDLRN